jgi:hypothetical protein
MGYIYKIEVAGELYIGSTKVKYLCDRQSYHNQSLKNPNIRNYNCLLYIFCREHNVEKIICELIEEVDNENIFIKEQEKIDLLQPSLNRNRAYITEEQKIDQQKELNKKYNNIKSNCPICGKEMLKNNIKKHINRIH